MRQVVINTYSFRELIEMWKDGKVSSQVVDRVRNELMKWSADSDTISEQVIKNTWKSVLEAVGFTNPVVSWSGFSSQGDGASFTSDCDLDKLIGWFTHPIEPSQSYDEANLLPWLAYKLNLDVVSRFCQTDIQSNAVLSSRENHGLWVEVVRKTQQYVHSRSCVVDFDIRGVVDNQILKLLWEFRDKVEHLRAVICATIYKDLTNEYEYLTSDEALLEFDEANEYAWDERGKIVRIS